ncbi:MAG: hypothetical protein M3O15_11565, partial [Acidobacteriota bacterium]|nr:hypothetical protein [Acidobacteriota bacterium]
GEGRDGSVFVRDLFERKVFPERGIASPSAGGLADRNRAVRLARVATVAGVLLLTLGVSWGYSRLAESKAILLPFLVRLEKTLPKERAVPFANPVRDARSGVGRIPGTAAEELEVAPEDLAGRPLDEPIADAQKETKALQVLLGMAQIDTGRFSSIFLPSSWFSDFNSDLRRSIVPAYNRIVLPALGTGLDRRARELIDGAHRLGELLAAQGGTSLAAPGAPVAAAAPAGGVSEPAVPLESTPEFGALARYAALLDELEGKGRNFNNLAESRDLAELADLVLYVMKQRLPASFFESSELYRQALGATHATPFSPGSYQPAAKAGALLLTERLLDRIYGDNALRVEIGRLTYEIDALGGITARGSETERFQSVLDHLGLAQQLLARPDLAWVSKKSFDPGPAFDRLLSQVRRIALLGPEVEQEIRGLGTAANDHFQEYLGKADTRFTGPLLLVDATGRWRLARNLEVLKGALSDLVGQSFMSAPVDQALRAAIPAGQRLLWDTRLLAAAAALREPYESFLDKGVRIFPPNLRGEVTTLAQNRMSSELSSEIAAAEHFEPLPQYGEPMLLERIVETQVEDFQAAGRSLSDLLAACDRLGLPELHDALATLLAAQGQRLLEAVDRLLEAEAPYRPREGSFSWWRGNRSVALEAFGTHQAVDLTGYLDAQRELIAHLARDYADPVIKTIGAKSRPGPQLRPLLSRWEGILVELQKYDSKKPGNSVAAVETLIASEMPQIDTGNCFAILGERSLQQPETNYFLKVRNSLRRGVLERCRELADDQAVASYRRIESAFNSRLAGRFPFAETIPEQLDAEAEPEDIRAFFEVFDANVPVLRALPPGDTHFGAKGDEVRRFLEQLFRVRTLFAGYLDAPRDPEPPAFDFEVEFRVNRKREAGGEEILRWEVASGDRRVALGDAERRLRWISGQPVRVRLGWAKDGPLVPALATGAHPRVDLAGRDVVYT